MKIVADTHLHFYPCYDLGRAFACLTRHLAALARDADVQLGFMAERHDCDVHARLLEGAIGAGGEVEIQPGADGKSVSVQGGGARGAGLYLLPGRQVVARERLEILALATSVRIPDRLPVVEVVERTLEAGGVPVLAWAPGKWFFGRGQIVRDLIARFEPGCLLLGDTSLRPGLWAEPFLMRAARRSGFRVVAGSDPLPFGGEEPVMGTYASLFDGAFDAARALESARDLLRADSVPALLGRRGGLTQVLRRLWKNASAGRPAAVDTTQA